MKRRGVLEDPSVRLVHADMIEAWARHLYVMQNLPGYTSSVRRAILGQCDDGRAAYVEYWRVGWRLWQTTEWIGPIAELGLPRPVPNGFEIARGLRMFWESSGLPVEFSLDSRLMHSLCVSIERSR